MPRTNRLPAIKSLTSLRQWVICRNGGSMDSNIGEEIENKNGVASFLLQMPGVAEPRVIKRATNMRSQVLMIGQQNDPAALGDIRQNLPNLTLRLPRPIAHFFGTDRPNEVVVVVGPASELTDIETAKKYASRPLNRITAPGARFVLMLEMLHELQVVTGFPGSGRRDYVIRFLRRLEGMAGPDHMSIIRTTTTRRQRSLADQVFFEHVTPEEFERRLGAGELIQATTYGNVSYGIDRNHALDVLSHGDGICVLVGAAVDQLARLGYPVHVTKIGLPIDSTASESSFGNQEPEIN